MQRLLLLLLLLIGVVVCYVKHTGAIRTAKKVDKSVLKDVDIERSAEKSSAKMLVLPLQAFNKTMFH